MVAQTVKNLPAMQETHVQSLGWKDPLGKRMATHSSILAWRIPWTKEPGGLWSMGSPRVAHDWHFHFTSPIFTCQGSSNPGGPRVLGIAHRHYSWLHSFQSQCSQPEPFHPGTWVWMDGHTAGFWSSAVGASAFLRKPSGWRQGLQGPSLLLKGGQWGALRQFRDTAKLRRAEACIYPYTEE